jgi:two-component system, cell cycle sensor histidine kinase and response regulator CckA
MAERGFTRTVRRRFKAILGMLVLSVASDIATAAEESVPVRIGFESSADPMSFVQADGSIAGFAVDLVNAIAREMGTSVRPVVGTWEEIFAKFNTRGVDVIANVAYTKERAAFVDFSVRHLSLRGFVFVRKGDHSIRAAADLANARVAIQRQSFSADYLHARGWDQRAVYVQDFYEALRAVDDGRCDAVAAVGVIGNHVIRTLGLKNVEASGVILEDYTFDFHMGVHSGETARLALLNEGLARVRENGTYDKIYEKWIGPLEPRNLRWYHLRPILLPAFGVAFAVLVALFWQRRMLGKLAEQAKRVRTSEERLRLVLEGSEHGFWDWDLRTNRMERSERWASMLGYTLAEIPPTLEAGTALVHPDDAQKYSGWQARLQNGADRYDIEYRMRTKSGEWLWILDRGKVVARHADGSPLRMAGTHTDISKRKRTEAALLESQALLKRSAQLLEQSQKTAHVGGWETDLRTGQVYWTDETHRIHQTTPTDFTPTRDSVYSFYTEASRRLLSAAAEKAIRDGTPFTLELELTTARQQRIHVHTACIAEQENGRVVKLYGSFRDITAEKSAEQEREKLRLKMLDAQKLESLGVLAGGIAHDFNNLLTAILANATFARSTAGANEERLAQIETAARRAADLCRQMLAYAGKGAFTVDSIDLSAVVNDTLQLINASISKKARLARSFAPSLPLVDGDLSQLRQVVVNLVINASEALVDGAGEIRISAGLARPDFAASAISHAFDLPSGDCVCLEVTDTGYGMPPATLARIFDPFFSTKFTGRGLGLAAVLGIVRAHRGAMTVNSTPGNGSTFRLFLPASPQVAAARAMDSQPAANKTRTAQGTILIADDEPGVLAAVDMMLRFHGYTTVLATTGHEAVQHFRTNPNGFAAVLLDLTMPGLDGAEALHAIRAENPRVPALVMSGFTEEDVLNRLRGAGRVVIMRKPFTHEILLQRIAEVVK